MVWFSAIILYFNLPVRCEVNFLTLVYSFARLTFDINSIILTAISNKCINIYIHGQTFMEYASEGIRQRLILSPSHSAKSVSDNTGCEKSSWKFVLTNLLQLQMTPRSLTQKSIYYESGYQNDYQSVRMMFTLTEKRISEHSWQGETRNVVTVLAYTYVYLLTGQLADKPTRGQWSRFTDDSRKVRFAQTHRKIRAGWFAQQGMIRAILWIFRASKLLCCVSFKSRSNYFIYLIYQLFVWALLVADVNLGYMHLSTKYYTL